MSLEWFPVLTCENPTGLTVTVNPIPASGNIITGRYVVDPTLGLVVVKYRINACVQYTPGVTTGKLFVTGLPFASENIHGTQNTGSLTFQCINADPDGVPNNGLVFTQFGSLLFPGEDKLRFFAAAQGLPEIGLEITNINNSQPCVLLEGTHTYFI